MTWVIPSIGRNAAFGVLAGLAGCVGAPVEPIAYQPAYAPQPAYAQPQPQAYAEPQPATQVAYGATCYAGFYTCALVQSLPLGAPCSCPGIGAPSYGNVR